MKFIRYWLQIFAASFASSTILLVGVHTYSPFGDQASHLSNFDAVAHALIVPACAFYSAWLINKKSSIRRAD